MNKYSVTLYDVIGYIVPGFLFIVFCLFFYSNLSSKFGIMGAFFKINLFWQILLAYTCGHILQSLTSLFMKVKYRDWWQKNKWDTTLKGKILDSVSAILHIEKAQVEINKETINLIELQIKDDNILNSINTYRAYQGFFRALTGFFIIASASLILTIIFKFRLFLLYDEKSHLFSMIELVSFSTIFVASSVITYKRFKRFTISKISTIVLTSINNSTIGTKNSTL